MTTFPVITNDVQALEYLAHFDGTITADLLSTFMARVGRNSGPQLVLSLFHMNRLTPDVLAVGVEAAWTGAEFPMRSLTVGEWVALFETTGYLVNAERRPDLLPTEPTKLYRGATLPGAFGWSWTDSRETAQWFADRPGRRDLGQVWTAMVAPHRLYARFDTARGEGEYVVDTYTLPIEVAS